MGRGHEGGKGRILECCMRFGGVMQPPCERGPGGEGARGRDRPDGAERAELSAGLEGMLSEDEAYQCLLTVPGIGPKTAAALVASIGISLFRGDSRLAAYCGLAPEDRDSGTSPSSATSTRAGNKALKNLLIFSCSPIVGTKNRFGRCYDRCVARGMRHNKALKAVARKRLRAIYAVMRDRVPYIEPSADGDVEKSSPAA